MRQSFVVQCRPGTKDTQKLAIANKIFVFTHPVHSPSRRAYRML